MFTYGDRIRLVRKHFGWTQAQAAEYLGIKQNMISRYERQEHQIPDEIKLKLHNIGIDLVWLLTGEGNMLRFSQQKTDLETLKKELILLEHSINQVLTEGAALTAMLKSIKNLFPS